MTVTTSAGDIRGGVDWPSAKLILLNNNTELATGNGYTAGGKQLTGVRFDYASGVVTVRADNISWRATGGSLSANEARLIAGGEVVAFIYFGATFTASQNSVLSVRWHSNGLITHSLA